MLGRTTTDTITVKDVPAHAFIVAYAKHLKSSQKVMPIENHYFLKTGFSREVGPQDEDWYYVRCAALARKLYLRPGLGVRNLQHIFGKKKRFGVAKDHHSKGSGKVIRHALNQLMEANVLMRFNDKRNNTFEGDNHHDKLYPKIVSPEGQKELNEIAATVFKSLYQQE